MRHMVPPLWLPTVKPRAWSADRPGLTRRRGSRPDLPSPGLPPPPALPRPRRAHHTHADKAKHTRTWARTGDETKARTASEPNEQHAQDSDERRRERGQADPHEEVKAMAVRAGRDSASWKRLKVAMRREQRDCWLCGHAIDYTLTAGPDSFSVDHIVPLSTAPHLAEVWSNLDAAHLACNTSRGSSDPTPGIGSGPRQW